MIFILLVNLIPSSGPAESTGERIAFYAEQFIGTPYDPDPLGSYVRKRVIIYDEMVDCMYLTFRAVELALSESRDDSIKVALDKRFISRGLISDDGTVLNYDERFQYGEDMIDSGKFGDEITSKVSQKIVMIEGSRGRDFVTIISKADVEKILPHLMSGDIVFFVKHPNDRINNEIVGHIGILKREGDNLFLIHASGKKGNRGKVVKVSFPDYVKKMPFAGIRITRFKSP